MRPGQAAPVFLSCSSSSPAETRRFNEAGAGCPGIQGRAGVPVQKNALASMRPGQAAPVFAADALQNPACLIASMRPGQAAPVFGLAWRRSRVAPLRFNEAGAGCPGILSGDRRPEIREIGLQ